MAYAEVIWLRAMVSSLTAGYLYLPKMNHGITINAIFSAWERRINTFQKVIHRLFLISGESEYVLLSVTILRFPVWSRNRNEYDLAIYSANWPEVRINVWNTLLKARAIENQCYVAGANRIGTDGMGINYCGESAIINPRGEIIKSVGNEESIISADLSLAELTEFRNKFPVFNDADDYSF